MIRALKSLGIISILLIALGADYFRAVPIADLGLRQIRNDLLAAFQSKEVHILEVTAFTAYAVIFAIWRIRVVKSRRSARAFSRVEMFPEVLANVSVGILLILAVVNLWLNSVDKAVDAAVFLWGVALSQGVGFFIESDRDAVFQQHFCAFVIDALIVLLCLSILLRPGWWDVFPYHDQRRWQGPWWNPNHFGLLMAAGSVLAMGRAIQFVLESRSAPKLPFTLSGYAIAIGLMSYSLIRSFSRGAWLGLAVGFGYLGWQFVSVMLRSENWKSAVWLMRSRKCLFNCLSLMRRNRVSVAAIVFSVFVLAFSNFGNNKNLIVHRIVSVVNANDFSWRRRITGYEGALQMMSSKALTGFGWENPKLIYEHFYRPSQLDEGKVIELNDFFMVGMTLGIPALVCFIGRLAVSFYPLNLAQSIRPEVLSDMWLRITSRAGLIVFVVCFWFDRGLFWLSLATPFWILVEFSEARPGGLPSFNCRTDEIVTQLDRESSLKEKHTFVRTVKYSRSVL
jgi:hypothetical protein